MTDEASDENPVVDAQFEQKFKELTSLVQSLGMRFDPQLLGAATPDFVALEAAVTRIREWNFSLFTDSPDPATALRWIEHNGETAAEIRTDYV